MQIRNYISVLLIVVLFATNNVVNAQQFTIKGGASYGNVSVPSREIFGYTERMLNYYWETNAAYRFGTCKFLTGGVGYLGAGCTFHDIFMPGSIIETPYTVEARFNNLIFPIKIKFSSEHRRKPRYYGYFGVAPAWMFHESRNLMIEKKLDKTRYLFEWTPRKAQLYLLTGGGIYYKHVLIETAAYVSTFKDYKEYEAPISFNSGFMLLMGYQVSRDSKKRW